MAKGESPLYFRGAITGSLNRTDIPPGYYCIGASGTISNGVVGTTDSYCLFIQFGDSYKTQMIIDGSGTHTRSYIGSPVTWTAWTWAASSGYASINTTYVTKVSTTEVRWFKMGNVVLVNLYDINLKAGYSTDNVAVIATGFPRAATSCAFAFPASDGSQFRTMLDGSTLKPWFNGTSKAVSISGSFMYISI